MPEKLKKVLKIVFTVALIVVSVYFALRGIQLKVLWKEIVGVDFKWIFLSIPVILASHWVRATRWKTMLKPALHIKHISSFDLFASVLIGYAFNCVLPRGGEILRPYLTSKKLNSSFSSVFATIIFERFFLDIVTLILVFALGLWLFSNRLLSALPNLNPNMVLVPMFLILFVLLLSFYPPVFRFIIEKTVKPISVKAYNKLHSIFNKFVTGFAVIKKPKMYLRLAVESFLIWFFYTVPMFLMFYCFGFQSTYHLGFDDAILLIIISGVGVTIAPTPGAIGVYHVLIQSALMKLYGLPAESALAYATVTHGVNYLVQLPLGGLFIFRERKYFTSFDIFSKLKTAEAEAEAEEEKAIENT